LSGFEVLISVFDFWRTATAICTCFPAIANALRADCLRINQSVEERKFCGQGNLIDSFRDADKRGAGVSRMRANW